MAAFGCFNTGRMNKFISSSFSLSTQQHHPNYHKKQKSNPVSLQSLSKTSLLSSSFQKSSSITMWGEDNNFSKKPQIPKSQSFTSSGSRGKKPFTTDVDQNGRVMRKRSGVRQGETNTFNLDSNNNDDNWGDDKAIDNIGKKKNKREKLYYNNEEDDWDNVDDFSVDTNTDNSNRQYYEPYEYSKPRSNKIRRGNSNGSGRGGRGRAGDRGGGGRGQGGRGGGRGGNGRENAFNSFQRINSKQQSGQSSSDTQEKKINLRALEGAGYVHLYGLAPIINALKAGKRDFSNMESVVNLDLLEGEDLEHELKQRDRKPEAQFTTWLFVQENMKYGSSGKTGDKAAAAQEVELLAKEIDIPIAYVDKGVLNALCGNRPHQGYVLRCGNLEFESMPQIPKPDDTSPTLWLCLDEVVDPQNFGALLRSAYFLGGSQTSVGVMVCSKNSAPPSPVVSAASAGALELCDIYSTSNLPKTLTVAKEKGWRVLGAAASAPDDMIDEISGENVICQDLQDVDVDVSKPTVIVLGSEGHGLRKLVARACSGFIRIPGNVVTNNYGNKSHAGVDSLNVSVTGGIILWHFLSANK